MASPFRWRLSPELRMAIQAGCRRRGTGFLLEHFGRLCHQSAYLISLPRLGKVLSQTLRKRGSKLYNLEAHRNESGDLTPRGGGGGGKFLPHHRSASNPQSHSRKIIWRSKKTKTVFSSTSIILSYISFLRPMSFQTLK